MEANLEVCYAGGCYGNSGAYKARSFLTREEKVEMLKEYKEALELEAKGVKERIAELEKDQKDE